MQLCQTIGKQEGRLRGIARHLQAVFDSTAARAHELLNKTIRKDDQKAYDVVIKKGIQATEAGDAAAWDAANKKVRDNLTGRTFSKSLVQSVEAAAKP